MKDISTETLMTQVVEWALQKKAENLLSIDLRGILDITDFFVVASAHSELQVRAIAGSIVDGATDAGQKPYQVEGLQQGRWVLIDFVDLVVHVMLPEERDRYRLERLWGDAELTRYDEEGKVVEVTGPAAPVEDAQA